MHPFTFLALCLLFTTRQAAALESWTRIDMRTLCSTTIGTQSLISVPTRSTTYTELRPTTTHTDTVPHKTTVTPIKTLFLIPQWRATVKTTKTLSPSTTVLTTTGTAPSYSYTTVTESYTNMNTIVRTETAIDTSYEVVPTIAGFRPIADTIHGPIAKRMEPHSAAVSSDFDRRIKKQELQDGTFPRSVQCMYTPDRSSLLFANHFPHL
jgi:hypothetical protein